MVHHRLASPAGLLLPLFLSLFLVACGEDATTPGAGALETADDVAAPVLSERAQKAQELIEHLPKLEDEGFNKPWSGDLDGMEERRVVRILTVYALGRYYLDEGQESGLYREIAQQYEDYLNESMERGHMRVHVVLIPVARDELLPELIRGRGDIAVASLSITPERQALVDFTTPASQPVSEILVTGPSAPAIERIEDLSGRTVYVRHSSSYRESVEALNESFAAQGLDPITIEPMSELLEDEDLVEMVNSGMLPWAIVDDYKVASWKGAFDAIEAREDIVFREGALMGWAVRKDSPKLLASLNSFLKTHRQGTLIGNVLINRYVRDFDWTSNALAWDDYGRLEDLAHIFREYGEQYGLDYLMIAAQGYQESRLRQEARSARGAIGVMQLLPSTARDPNVGIPDISEVEPNIHAGVRYMSFLRDRYFSDPGVDKLNQILLALAAYNAGPARMINLRREAEQAGYDPDVWFDNVEVIAARRIGRETVQYVANIYKYYMAYRLVAEQKLERELVRAEAGLVDEG